MLKRITVKNYKCFDELTFDLSAADYSYNPILVVGIPYFLLSVWVDYGKNSNLKQRVRTLFFSAKALKIMVVVIIAYWIGRNLF